MTQALPFPVSPAPAVKSNDSPAEADEKKKIAKTETDILCSESKLFQIIRLR
jgi:hypothetical protein